MATVYKTSQYFTTTLNVGGGIDNSQTTGIVIADDSGIDDITQPGIALVNYADPLNTATAEWITFTSISSKELQGVTRGAEGYAAKAHDNGVTVAFPISMSHINNMADRLDGSETIDNDLDMGDTYNIKYNSADPWRTISLTPGFLKPTSTDGCAAVETIESSVEAIDYDVLAFDNTTDEFSFAGFRMPDSWDGGNIQYRYSWTCAAGVGSASETVQFSMGGRSYADGDALDQATSSVIDVSDTWQADGDVHLSSWSANLTLAGGAAAGEKVFLLFNRNVSEDDLGGDAQILDLQIRYKQAQFGD